MAKPKACWICLYDGVHENVKIKRVGRDLGLTPYAVVGHMTALWCWTMKHRSNGELDGLTEIEIADASGYDGDPLEWCIALSNRRLITGTRINDWDDIQQKVTHEAAPVRQARFQATTPSLKHKPSATACDIAARYADGTGKQVTEVVLRSIEKLLTMGKEKQVRQAVDAYIAKVHGSSISSTHVIEAYNFFGLAAKYEYFVGRHVSKPSPELLTPEQQIMAWRYARITLVGHMIQNDGMQWRTAVSKASRILSKVVVIPKDDRELEPSDDWKPEDSLAASIKEAQ